jgi:hypothetical protein
MKIAFFPCCIHGRRIKLLNVFEAWKVKIVGLCFNYKKKHLKVNLIVFFRGIYLKMVKPCNLVKLELCKNISKNFVSNIHKFLFSFHMRYHVLSLFLGCNSSIFFYHSFIGIYFIQHSYMCPYSFQFTCTWKTIHILQHTTLTSVVSSGTATEWILFFPVHPTTHPSGMVRWWAGVLLVRSGPVVDRTTFGCIPIIDTYPYGTHTYGSHTYGTNTYGALTYGTPYLRLSSSRIEDVAIAPGHVISGPRSACG